MKKYNNIFWVLFLCLLSLYSCKEDDEIPSVKNTLLGNWELTEVEMIEFDLDSNATDTQTFQGSDIGTIVLQFNEDGTYATNSEDVFFMLYDFGVWEFTQNEEKIEFSKGVYGFEAPDVNYEWEIVSLGNNTLQATHLYKNASYDSESSTLQTYLTFTFTATSNTPDTHPNTIIDNLIQRWSVKTVIYELYEEETLLNVDTLSGFGTDIEFFTDSTYVFDANNNEDFQELLGSEGVWVLDFPYRTLLIGYSNDEGKIDFRNFRKDVLSASEFVMSHQFDEVIEEGQAGDEGFTSTSYRHAFTFYLEPFDETLDALVNPVDEIIGDWSLDYRVAQTINPSGEITFQDTLSGFGVDITFNSNENYVMDVGESEFWLEKLSNGGMWELDFPYTILSCSFNQVDATVTRTFEILSITDSELVLLETSLFETPEGTEVDQDYYYFVPFDEVIDEEPHPVDLLSKRWSLESIDYRILVDEELLNEESTSGYGTDMIFNNNGSYVSHTNYNISIREAFGGNGNWEFSETFDNLSMSFGNDADDFSRFDVLQLAEDTLVLYLEVEYEDFGSDFEEEHTYHFVTFDESLDNETHPAEIIGKQWSLSSYDYRETRNGNTQTTNVSGYGADITFLTDTTGNFSFQFDHNTNTELLDLIGSEGDWQFSATYTYLLFTTYSSFVDIVTFDENNLTLVLQELGGGGGGGGSEGEFILYFTPFSEELDTIPNPSEYLTQQWSLVSTNYEVQSSEEDENIPAMDISGYGASIQFNDDFTYTFDPLLTSHLGTLLGESGSWEFSTTYEELEVREGGDDGGGGGPQGLDLTVNKLTATEMQLTLSVERFEPEGEGVTVENYTFDFIPYDASLADELHPVEIISNQWSLSEIDYTNATVEGNVINTSKVGGYGVNIDFKDDGNYDINERLTAELLEVLGQGGDWVLSFPYIELELTEGGSNREFELEIIEISEERLTIDYTTLDGEARDGSTFNYVLYFIPYDETLTSDAHPFNLMNGQWSLDNTDYKEFNLEGELLQEQVVAGYGADILFNSETEQYELEHNFNHALSTNLGEAGVWDLDFPYDSLELVFFDGVNADDGIYITALSNEVLTLTQTVQESDSLYATYTYNFIPYDEALDNVTGPASEMINRWYVHTAIDLAIENDVTLQADTLIADGSTYIEFFEFSSTYFFEAGSYPELYDVLGELGTWDLSFTFEQIDLTTTVDDNEIVEVFDILERSTDTIVITQSKEVDGVTYTTILNLSTSPPE